MASMTFKEKMSFAYTNKKLEIKLNIKDLQQSWMKKMVNYFEEVLGEVK